MSNFQYPQYYSSNRFMKYPNGSFSLSIPDPWDSQWLPESQPQFTMGGFLDPPMVPFISLKSMFPLIPRSLKLHQISDIPKKSLSKLLTAPLHLLIPAPLPISPTLRYSSFRTPPSFSTTPLTQPVVSCAHHYSAHCWLPCPLIFPTTPSMQKDNPSAPWQTYPYGNQNTQIISPSTTV